MTQRRPDGFTLIELLIAIALMAIFSVLGWRGLDSVLSSRERIVQVSDNLRALSVTFTQMQEDLRRAWPVRLLNPPVPALGFIATQNGSDPVLMLLRESLPASGVPQIQQVVYRLRAGVLERGFAPWVQAAALSAGADAAASTRLTLDDATLQRMTWQPVLNGVRGLQLRAWVPGQGWLPAAALLEPLPEQIDQGASQANQTSTAVQAIPTGLEIALERESGGQIVRVLTVKD